VTRGLSLSVLGTATPYPRPGQPCSGYLLRTPDTAVWIDVGSGTMAELQRHLPLNQIQAIWISHLHPDHYSDLLAVYNWLVNASPSRPPLPVFGPPGWMGRTASLI
jgi:ribonuclease BN (tRNA processing enzyme)